MGGGVCMYNVLIIYQEGNTPPALFSNVMDNHCVIISYILTFSSY